MESNNFGDVVNVIWESLIAGSNALTNGALSSDNLTLVVLGVACIIAIRRYLPTLAAARTLQPAGAIEIQRAMRASPAPLSAQRHVVADHTRPIPMTPNSDGSSHAA